jgi:hypothetical protein
VPLTLALYKPSALIVLAVGCKNVSANALVVFHPDTPYLHGAVEVRRADQVGIFFAVLRLHKGLFRR